MGGTMKVKIHLEDQVAKITRIRDALMVMEEIGSSKDGMIMVGIRGVIMVGARGMNMVGTRGMNMVETRGMNMVVADKPGAINDKSNLTIAESRNHHTRDKKRVGRTSILALLLGLVVSLVI